MALPQGAIVLRGHTDRVCRIVPLPDGGRIATASEDATLRVFCTATGTLLRTLAGRGRDFIGLAALGGDLLASSDGNSNLRVWNARTGECPYDGFVGLWIWGIAALSAGRFVASTFCDVVLFEHDGGRNVTEVCRTSGAHYLTITDVSVCDERFATASSDGKAMGESGASLAKSSFCASASVRFEGGVDRSSVNRCLTAASPHLNVTLQRHVTNWMTTGWQCSTGDAGRISCHGPCASRLL
jgi:WD40 repeat protein